MTKKRSTPAARPNEDHPAQDRAAIRVLIGAEAGKRPTDLFPEALDELRPDARGEVVEVVYAVLRDWAHLSATVERLANPPVRERDRARAIYFLHQHLRGARGAEEVQASLQNLELAQAASVYAGVLTGLAFEARLALEHHLPEWLVAQLLADHGPVEGERLVRAQSEAPPFTLRVNTLRSTREALQAALRDRGVESTPTRWASAGLTLDRRRDVYSWPEFHAGAFEVQDEGSQLIAELVAPPPKGLVVDLCAGAGGKTLALAALLKGQGRLIAADVPSAEHRLKELRRRAARAQLTNLQVISTPAEGPLPEALAHHAGAVDRVLVDAPCSGTGVLRRNPEARLSLAPERIERLVATQRRIVERALGLLHPRGRLIYATCSLLRAENDLVLEQILAAHPGLTLVPAKEIWGKAKAEALGDGQVLRLLPSRQGTDGFYAAVLRPKT